jgi:hypothetical protein
MSTPNTILACSPGQNGPLIALLFSDPASAETGGLTFADERTLIPERLRAVLPGLAGDYGFPLERLQLPEPGGDVELSVALSLAGKAVNVWFHAPVEEDANFFPAYAAVSMAIQRLLRNWVPYLYFDDASVYVDPGSVFPLLVYQCLTVFSGQPRCEFTQDLVEQESPLLGRPSVARRLVPELERIRLRVAPGTKLARCYHPDRAAAIAAGVRSQPKLLNAMLSAEAFLVDSLIRLAAHARQFHSGRVRDSRRAAKRFDRFLAGFASEWERRLRRMYAGRDFRPLATLLLMEATAVLNTALGRQAPVHGVLRIRSGRTEQVLFGAKTSMGRVRS